MRFLFFILLSLLLLMQYHLWLGKNGLRDKHQLKEEVAIATESNEKLILRNEMMFSEIDDLKRGSNAIEERARNELGLVKEGETFFHVVPKE